MLNRSGARGHGAQVDSGYADTYWPYSVDINEPFLVQLKQAVPSLTLAGLVLVSGCGQEDALREVYVAPGWRLNIVPDIPQRPIPFDSFHLIVKPSATECGGIGPMQAPAAQLRASFLRAFGTTLFMPASAELWIRLTGVAVLHGQYEAGLLATAAGRSRN